MSRRMSTLTWMNFDTNKNFEAYFPHKNFT